MLELESLYDLFVQLNATMGEAVVILSELQTQDATEQARGISQLVCGRDDSILQVALLTYYTFRRYG